MRKRASALSLLVLLYATSVVAAPAEVVDEGRFFSEDAVATANQQLAQIRQQHGVDLRVETYSSIPSELRAQYAPDRRAEFFSAWAYQRAKTAGVNGALVLITRDPSYLQIVVGERTRRSAFTSAERDGLRDTMLAEFKQKRYDQGLLRGIESFKQAVSSQDRSAAAAPAPSGSGMGSSPQAPSAIPSPAPRPSFSITKLLFWGALILVAIFLLRRMFARRASQYPNAGPTGPYPQQDPYYNQGYSAGGGGFGRGFGGGILGGLLGGWLGGRMFGGGGQQAFGSTTPPQDQPADSGGGVFSDQAHQQDFMADQGGFQDIGGGGDFGGGGDAGGGGDSGGGGDF